MLSRRWALFFTAAVFGVYIVWLKILEPSELFSRKEFFHMSWIAFQRTDESAIPSLSQSELENRQVFRKKVILESCKNSSADDLQFLFSHPSHKASFRQIIVDDNHKLLYCYVPKVACTNWKRLLMIVMGKTNATDISSIDRVVAHKLELFQRLDDYTPDEIRYRLDNYLKFMFVRHPFERILSPYRDKLNPGNEYFRQTYGRKIIQRYRFNASQDSVRTGDGVTFQEFIRYLINFQSSEENVALNEHWRPMADLCLPFTIRYDIIGKYETIGDDAWLVLEKAGLGQRVKFPLIENSTTSSLLNAFLTQLTKFEVKQLNQIYKLDFSLFGYYTIA